MAFVYILKSQKNNRFYIGSTIDVDNRFIKHQKGEVKATKNLRPLTLEFYQYFPTIKEAKIIEYKLKKLKRRDYIEKIIKDKKIRMKLGP